MDRLGEVIRGYVQRHRTIIGGVSSLLTAAVFFIPSSSRYYEVIAEGIYAVSKIVDYAANLVLTSKSDSWRSIRFYTCEASRLLAVVEVFIERYSQHFPNVLNYESTILWIESIKGICRLILLYSSSSSSMIINWFRSESYLALENQTITHYRALCDSRAADFVQRMADSSASSKNKYYNNNNNNNNKNNNNNSSSSSSASKSGSFVNLSSPIALDVYNSPFVASPIRPKQTSPLANPSFSSPHDDQVPSQPSSSSSSSSSSSISPSLPTSPSKQLFGTDSFHGPETAPFQGRRSGITLLKHAKPSALDFDLRESVRQFPDLNPSSNSNSSSNSQSNNILSVSNSSSPGKTTCSDSLADLCDNNSKSNSLNNSSIEDDITQIYELDNIDRSGGVENVEYSINQSSSSSSSSSRDNTKSLSEKNNFGAEMNSSESDLEEKSLIKMFIAHVKKVLQSNPLSSSSNPIAAAGVDPSETVESDFPSFSAGSYFTSTSEDINCNINATSYISKMSPRTLLTFGEVLYVLRPVIYALLLKQASLRHSASALTHTLAGGNGAVANKGEGGGGNGGIAAASSGIYAGGLGALGEKNDQEVSSSSRGDSGALTTSLLYYKTFAVIISLITELVSIKLTESALKRVREESIIGAIKEFETAAANNSSSNSSGSGSSSRRLSMELEMKTKIKLFMAFQDIKINHQFDEELKRRKTYLFFYLLRSPVFDKLSLPILRAVSRIVSGIPLLNSLPDSILSVLQYFNRTHFYNSSSS